MNAVKRFCFATIFVACFCLTICADQSKWIDPHDMGHASIDSTNTCGDSECTGVKSSLATCKSELEAVKSMDRINLPVLIVEQFQKFIKNLSENFCLLKLNDHEKFQIKFKFTQEQCKNMVSFAMIPSTDPDHVMMLRDTLADFLKHSEQVSDYQSASGLVIFTNFCFEHFYGILTVALVTALTVNGVWVFSRVAVTRRLVFAVMVFVFLVSIPWNWWYMYKKKEAGKLATMAKAGSRDPCGRKSLWQSLGSFFSIQKDECTQHTEAFNIHAAVEVNPLMAVSVTISRMFLEPLEYVGIGINKLITSTTEGLPFVLQLTLAVLVFVMAILSLFLVFGYRVQTVFGSLGPGGPRRSELERVMSQNKTLEREILELKNRLQDGSGKAPAVSHSGGGDSGRCLPSPSTPSSSSTAGDGVSSPEGASGSSPE